PTDGYDDILRRVGTARGCFRGRHRCAPLGSQRDDRSLSRFPSPGDVRRSPCFRDRLFAYCEDVDFSLRRVRAGFRALVVPAALVHHGTTYTDQRRAQRVYYSIRNLIEVMRKHARWYHWIGFVPAFAVQWVAFFVFLACWRRQWGLIRAVSRGLLDRFRGCLGEIEGAETVCSASGSRSLRMNLEIHSHSVAR